MFNQTIDFGVPARYRILFSTSPIFESALGIAAYTWPQVHDKLAGSADDLRALEQRLPYTLKRELDLSGRAHTWRSLLYLAHRCDDLITAPWIAHLDTFLDWMASDMSRLIERAAPFLGETHAAQLTEALSGNPESQQHLLTSHRENPVIHGNLQYLFATTPKELFEHLTALLTGWYQQLVPDWMAIMAGLEQDRAHHEKLAQSLEPDELVRTVIKGTEFHPQPGIDRLWLIPQLFYRPFTIVNHLPGTWVYYYPLSDVFLPGEPGRGSAAKVVAVHKALGDTRRLELLTLLREAPKSLAQLTETLGATKSNVHHHLVLLRAAGLVRVESGVYTMNTEAVLQVGGELRAYLNLSTP